MLWLLPICCKVAGVGREQAALSFGFVTEYTRQESGKATNTAGAKAAGYKPPMKDTSTEYRRGRAACTSTAATLSQRPTDPLSQCQPLVLPGRELAPLPQDSVYGDDERYPVECNTEISQPEGSVDVSVPSLDLERCHDSSLLSSSFTEPLSPRYQDSGEWG
jgi:hypothetical protein